MKKVGERGSKWGWERVSGSIEGHWKPQDPSMILSSFIG